MVSTLITPGHEITRGFGRHLSTALGARAGRQGQVVAGRALECKRYIDRTVQSAATRYTQNAPAPTARMVLTRRGRAVRNVTLAGLAAGALIMGANVFTIDAAAAQTVGAATAVSASTLASAQYAPGVVPSLETVAAAQLAAQKGAAAKYVIVANGETLWQIAAQRTPEGGDVREQIKRISAANGLDGEFVYAGQVLQLPAVGQ